MKSAIIPSFVGLILLILFLGKTVLTQRIEINELKAEITEKQAKVTQQTDLIARMLDESVDRDNLDKCIASAELLMHNRWIDHCKEIGEEEQCLLPNITARDYESDKQNAIDICFRRFDK